jgi:DNA-binding transcriptional LysR family regulator
MIDLVALQSLLRIAELGTVGAAADSLGYTPSAVSQQVKRLERELGVGLLERVGRGVVLTERGRQLVT